MIMSSTALFVITEKQALLQESQLDQGTGAKNQKHSVCDDDEEEEEGDDDEGDG